MKKPQNPATFRIRDAEYDKMIQIYIKYGINTQFCYAQTMRDIQSALASSHPEIVLCANRSRGRNSSEWTFSQ